jgi:hypothetical protein
MIAAIEGPLGWAALFLFSTPVRAFGAKRTPPKGQP